MNSQASLEDQLRKFETLWLDEENTFPVTVDDLNRALKLANFNGLYDAADHIQDVVENKGSFEAISPSPADLKKIRDLAKAGRITISPWAAESLSSMSFKNPDFTLTEVKLTACWSKNKACKGGFEISWKTKSAGFGQVIVYLDEENKVHCDNQAMGRVFIKEVFEKLIDSIELQDWSHDPKTYQDTDLTPQQIVAEIAKNVLDIETLETRYSDRLDFHDVSANSIKKALLRAFEAGKATK